MSRDDEIDRLYQLPLNEFTSARNALAKGAKDAAGIRALDKPPTAAWAVNQLYWHHRRTWDALIDAAENLRKVNKAVLGGRSGDVRAAGAAHDAAVHDALKVTLGILEASGHSTTDATRQAVLNTLRALPAADPPGRLTRTLQPGGFEMLAGLAVTGRAPAAPQKARHQPREAKEPPRAKADVKALTQARSAAAAAERALRDAEQAVRRHEFEIARATRDEERAAKSVDQAREALDAAKTALADAEREQKQSAARREAAEQAARKAESTVASARREAAEAATALKKIERG